MGQPLSQVSYGPTDKSAWLPLLRPSGIVSPEVRGECVYLSTSAILALNQFMKADVSSDSVK